MDGLGCIEDAEPLRDPEGETQLGMQKLPSTYEPLIGCLLYTSDAADD